MAGPPRARPTLFDKLVSGSTLEGMIDSDDRGGGGVEGPALMGRYSVPQVERFNEEALRTTVRRELAWLLNTTHFNSRGDLADYPHVRTSVLNYGVPDLTGRPRTRRLLLERARALRTAILAFEPRIAEASLVVEIVEDEADDQPVRFVIHADVTAAVHALPVQFTTEIDSDLAAVVVRG